MTNFLRLSIFCFTVFYSQTINADGEFFNADPYSSGSDDTSWKDNGDTNPWLIENSASETKNTNSNNAAVSNSNNKQVQPDQNSQFQMPQQGQQFQSPQNQRYPNTNQGNQQGFPANSAGRMPEIYLQRVNSDLTQTNRGPGSRNAQQQNGRNPAAGVQPQMNNGNRGFSNANQQDKNNNNNAQQQKMSDQRNDRTRGHFNNPQGQRGGQIPFGPPQTTTTTSSTTTKYGAGMFFNQDAYKTDTKKDGEQEDWKRNDETNPFLVDDPNKPRPPPVQHNPNSFGQPGQNMRPQNYDPRRPPQDQQPPQKWKTKWEMEDEAEEKKAQILEKAKYLPPSINKIERYQKQVDVAPIPVQSPADRRNRPHHHQQNQPRRGGNTREDFERSGEIEKVSKDFYKDKHGTLAPDFKFIEPDPEPINLPKHSKRTDKRTGTWMQDPPTSIQNSKNWFLIDDATDASNSKTSEKECKIMTFILTALWCINLMRHVI